MKLIVTFACALTLTACGGSSDDLNMPLQPQQDQDAGTDTDATVNGTLINTALGNGAAAGDFTRGECIDTFPLADGIGWDGLEECVFDPQQVLQQVADIELQDTTWDCVRRFPRSGGLYQLHMGNNHIYSTRDIINGEPDGWNIIGEWSVQADAVTVHLDYVGDGFDEFTYSSANSTLNAPLGDIMGEFCDLTR